MTGIEEGIAALITSLTAAAPEAAGASALAAAAPTATAVAGTTAAAAGTAATAGSVLAGAGTAAAGAAGAGAAAGGITALGALEAASAVAGIGGTAAQLLADKPKAPAITPPITRDDAQREADLRSELYRRRGRAAALLTSGGAQGDTSKASLGAASLLGG